MVTNQVLQDGSFRSGQGTHHFPVGLQEYIDMPPTPMQPDSSRNSLRRTLAALALMLAGASGAAPYIPANGQQVVERLPSRASPVQRELLRMRAVLSKTPHKLPLAVGLAQRYIEQARIDGDPRYLGYAEAALAPWWTLAQPPSEVLVLRATLRQSTHQFAAALADLDTVLQRDPGNLQAWLTRATVQTISGDFAGARASCTHLDSLAPALVVQTCINNVGSVTGQAAQSYRRLRTALEQDPDPEPGVRIWALTLLAEMAARGGDAAGAEAWFQQALADDDADSYLLAAYADFLLDHGRAPEAVKLLKDKTRVDALLLRYALALKAGNRAEAALQSDVLRSRFDAAMLRGDTVHQREQARFELKLRNDPNAAVRLAKLNWAVQKEPADLRILVEAAAASGDQQAAQMAIDWITKTGLEDRALDACLGQLKARP
jgi:Tfp pilus assembly protein PilF